MPNTRNYLRSFAGGEVSPEMFGRIDDIRYQTGAAKMRNFIAKPQGPAQNRPGFGLVREVKDSTKKTRLIPFTFSVDQTYVIELGAGYFRFHSDGGTLLDGGLPYEVANTYTESELFDINYVQSNDVLTLVHPNHPPAELRRYDTLDWQFVDVAFTPPLTAPENVNIDVDFGRRTRISHVKGTTSFGLGFVAELEAQSPYPEIPFSKGDPIYLSGTLIASIAPGFYQVGSIVGGSNNRKITLAHIGTGNPVVANTSLSLAVDWVIQYAENSPDTIAKYKVTAVGESDISESTPSSPAIATNNLFASGAFNTISWDEVTGAVRYNVYKEQNGLYGYIGQTEELEFVDDNIAPDMGISPPEYDDTLTSAGNYPASVAYFEQRRVFAGTDNEPQNIWMTKSGTESDFSYQIPIRDADRISFQIASREANRVKHIVPLTELILLTNSAEWRVTSVNSDAITPSSIAVRPQSYIGASGVRPTIVNNSLVYCAARGGHVRELGYNDSVRGFVTNDISLRAAHLFDNLTISDQAYQKSPLPIVWFVSSDGKLLGLTYIPEQQIGAWHQHDSLESTFESCCVIAEGDEDRLYVVVRRPFKSPGEGTVYKRYVERMGVWKFETISDAFFVDSGLSFDGTNTTSTTMTVTGGTLWDPSEELTLTSSTPQFVTGPSSTDIGDIVELDAADGQIYRLTIVSVTSTTEVQVRTDKVIAESLRNSGTSAWGFCRNSFSGLDHLEYQQVSILADGARHNPLVVENGAVTLSRASRKVHIGLPIEADLQTLPMTLQIDGFGQGRHKNVNRVWLRVFRSSGVLAGPDASSLVPYKQRVAEPYGTPPSLMSEQIEVVLHPSWDEDGQVYIRQADPLPLTIAGLTIEVALGG
jgi:hypothetical protein